MPSAQILLMIHMSQVIVSPPPKPALSQLQLNCSWSQRCIYSCLNHSWGPVKLVQACLHGGKVLHKTNCQWSLWLLIFFSSPFPKWKEPVTWMQVDSTVWLSYHLSIVSQWHKAINCESLATKSHLCDRILNRRWIIHSCCLVGGCNLLYCWWGGTHNGSVSLGKHRQNVYLYRFTNVITSR